MEALAAPASDEALVSRAAAGDEAAFEELVRRHQERVYRLACRLTGDDADAADVLQETFLQVFRHLGEFRGEARFTTWLFRVVTNAALMRRRTRARRPADSLEAYMPRFDAEGPRRSRCASASRADAEGRGACRAAPEAASLGLDPSLHFWSCAP